MRWGIAKYIDMDLNGLTKHRRNSVRYYAKLFIQTPKWVDRDEVRRVYRKCKELRRKGFDVVVDHIVPLSSDIVCGLHWHVNLQIISARQNELKSNLWWPDCPHENLDLFGDPMGVEQYEIPLY